MSPAFQDSLPEPDEGWGVIRPGDRKAHYYRKMFSLCLRIGLYNGPLEPDENHSPDDCAACRKVLDKEAAEQGPETAEHDYICPTCGCGMHFCADDCDCCPEHRHGVRDEHLHRRL